MKHRLMIVDDEPEIRETMSLLLASCGYHVCTASSSVETLQILGSTPIDLVVLDLGLANEDGLAFLPSLKRKFPNIKVLILTGLGFEDDFLQEAQQKGADGYVVKGGPIQELLEEISRVLQLGMAEKVA